MPFLDPGSGIGFFSGFQAHIFDSLMTNSVLDEKKLSLPVQK
jgi:hypothetical protein